MAKRAEGAIKRSQTEPSCPHCQEHALGALHQMGRVWHAPCATCHCIVILKRGRNAEFEVLGLLRDKK